MRRVLAIDEQSFGPDHPNIAIRLNNLAQVLQATNRLAEAEPLMRRGPCIFFKFTRQTGHEHPHLPVVRANYVGLLNALGRSEAEIQSEIASLVAEAGLGASSATGDEPDAPDEESG